MTKLTERQQEILSLIESHMNATGSPPTRAEIAKIMGFKSPNAAEDHLRALARKGVIELVPGTSRGIRLIQTGNGIPVIKIDRLSSPFTITDTPIENTCKLDRNFFKPSIDFILHFTHKGIPDLNILENDYLAIHCTQEIHSGQIVLLRIQQELILKRFATDLQYQNSQIEGLVVGLIRPLTSNSFLS